MPKESDRQVQVAVRFPSEWLDRLDKLAQTFSHPGLALTRTDAIRMALARGLDEMERDAGLRARPRRVHIGPPKHLVRLAEMRRDAREKK